MVENGLFLESIKRGQRIPVSTTTREKTALNAELAMKIISGIFIFELLSLKGLDN